MLMATGQLKASAELKGRSPQRKRPDDFDVIFVEQGRLDCERWYRASRITVNRWMDETPGGPGRLITARAAYVSHMRKAGKWMTRSTKLVEHREIERPSRLEAIRDRRKVNLTVARHAAQHLRIVRNGGFIVSMAGNGDWWVGSKRMSAAQMVDVAKAKGFDVRAVEREDERRADGPAGRFNRSDFAGEDRRAYHKDWATKLLHDTPNVERKLGRLDDE
jgi:hypothetical protein